MADTLAERVTGQATAAEVQIVMHRGRASLAQRRLRFATE
jgi:hypothetical protein